MTFETFLWDDNKMGLNVKLWQWIFLNICLSFCNIFWMNSILLKLAPDFGVRKNEL